LKEAQILIADDCDTCIDTLEVLCRRIPGRVSRAGTGCGAVMAVMQRLPELVVMDIEMPEMDGIEATRRIRRLEIDTQPAIIGYTSLPLGEARDRGIGAGMNDVLPKDVAPEEFLRRVRLWLGWRNPRQGARKIPATLDMDQFMCEMYGDRSLAISVLDRFVESGEDRLHTIESAEHAGDFEALYRAAHALKGGALNIRARGLSEAAHALERMAKLEVHDDLGRLVTETRIAFDALVRYVDSLKRKGA
jgi:CheY-like chemotaxis protein/HPt (histidine-containing phosphotransfer) domain-containing protein